MGEKIKSLRGVNRQWIDEPVFETTREDVETLMRVADVGILGCDPVRIGRVVRDILRMRVLLGLCTYSHCECAIAWGGDGWVPDTMCPRTEEAKGGPP